MTLNRIPDQVMISPLGYSNDRWSANIVAMWCEDGEHYQWGELVWSMTQEGCQRNAENVADELRLREDWPEWPV